MQKHTNATSHRDRTYHYVYNTGSGQRESSGYTSYTEGAATISYDDGRKLPSGHWPWKKCVHTCTNAFRGEAFRSHLLDVNSARGFFQEYWHEGKPSSPYISRPTSLPTNPWDSSTANALLSQIDLNSGESTLLYSGILQAVPLVGGALKFTSVLNKAAKKLSKSFRKQPFTTVVKTLISADFIDRFVISPTIDDARRFMDATNYVLRTLETAQERNASRFALQASSSLTHQHKERTVTQSSVSGLGGYNLLETLDVQTVSKAFILLEAKYDIGGLSPIKLWARRVGLTRPLDSVWDLVPFSFVIDYFTRAGDFISHLSDEMSSVEGLKGVITKVHDMWGSVENRVLTQWTATHNYWPRVPRGYTRTMAVFESGRRTMKSSRYERFRIPDPYGYLLQLQATPEDWLSLNLELSSTRKRTIAELIIQAKL